MPAQVDGVGPPAACGQRVERGAPGVAGLPTAVQEDHRRGRRIADLVGRDQIRPELVALGHVLRQAEAADELGRLHVAGGAKRVSVMHNRPLHFFPEKGDLDKFLAEVARRPWGANWFGLFSAHQMGTCRMGGDRNYPVKPNGETREVRNLYVADGSLFPSASGTNPMLSIQALAWWVAQNMKH